MTPFELHARASFDRQGFFTVTMRVANLDATPRRIAMVVLAKAAAGPAGELQELHAISSVNVTLVPGDAWQGSIRFSRAASSAARREREVLVIVRPDDGKPSGVAFPMPGPTAAPPPRVAPRRSRARSLAPLAALVLLVIAVLLVRVAQR